MSIRVENQRAYDFVQRERPKHAHVVLVDRIWPRGLSKQSLEGVNWLKQLAPSTELRKWFDHRESRWKEFKRRYRSELHCCEDELDRLRAIARRKRLILLYGSRDTEHNQAVVLKDLLENESTKGAT